MDINDKEKEASAEFDPVLLKTLQELKAVEKREASNAAIRKKMKNRKEKTSKESKELNKYVKYSLVIWPILIMLFIFTKPEAIVINDKKNEAQAQEIMQYLSNNFGVKGSTASWFIEIDGINIYQNDKNRYIEVLTTLEKDAEGIVTASSLCGAVSNYWYNHSSELDGIRIRGVGNKIIGHQYSVSSPCS